MESNKDKHIHNIENKKNDLTISSSSSSFCPFLLLAMENPVFLNNQSHYDIYNKH
jgi:hypothetical protein